MPDCAYHGGAYDEKQYDTVAITNGTSSVTMRDWLESFAAASPVGVSAARIDGFGGDVVRCDGDLPFGDGFESGDA